MWTCRLPTFAGGKLGDKKNEKQSQHFIRSALRAGFTGQPASAQDEDSSGGVYMSGSTGVVVSDDQLINGFTAAGAPRRIITDMDKGSAFALALGYATKDADWGRVRAELEFAKQKAELKALSLNAVDRALIGEPDKSVKTGMFNIYYDTPALLALCVPSLAQASAKARWITMSVTT